VPLHLVGDFGVSTSPDGSRRLVEPARAARFFDLDAAALPHFAGTLRYSKKFPAATFAGFDALALPNEFEDIFRLRINGIDAGVRAWSPYEWSIPSHQSHEGDEVEVELSVTNTLLRFLEGRVWNARTGEKRPV
jgi:hypothetical protein